MLRDLFPFGYISMDILSMTIPFFREKTPFLGDILIMVFGMKNHQKRMCGYEKDNLYSNEGCCGRSRSINFLFCRSGLG